MKLLRVPPIFVGGYASMVDLLIYLGRVNGYDRKYIEGLCNDLPAPIRSCPCFLDCLTNLWRYDYGNPFTGLPNGGAVFGTQMYQQVENLLDVMIAAKRMLKPAARNAYLLRLADQSKHEDALAEFMPMIRVREQLDADFEVTGHCEGNRTVDWVIRTVGKPLLLIDIKNRSRDLFELLAALDTESTPTSSITPAPSHDPALLFKSLETKFRQSDKSTVVQLAWIKTGVKQNRVALNTAFENLDNLRVHYAILGDWKDDVYVMGPDDETRKWIIELLRVHESTRFVF